MLELPAGTVMAKGRTHGHKTGMNKLEAEYAAFLQDMHLAGEIVAWKFEGMKLRLADRTFYTPDFMVVRVDGAVEFIEAKGHWEDDARVKIKVAAETFPWFHFSAVQKRPVKHGGGWLQEWFGAKPAAAIASEGLAERGAPCT